LSFCHDQACGGHFGAKKTAEKVLNVIFISPPSLKTLTSSANLAHTVNMWAES